MTLEEFVRTTVVDILRGVRAAQEEIEKTTDGGRINPLGTDRLLRASELTCDVAVTASATGGTTAGVTVLGVFGAGVKGDARHEQVHESRIKFSIPIEFPPMPSEAKRRATWS